MTEFFTSDSLLTFAGQVLFVTMGTQLIKKYIEKLDPKWIALVLSVFISLAANLVLLSDTSKPGLLLMFVNTFVVLSSSITAYETAIKPVTKSKVE